MPPGRLAGLTGGPLAHKFQLHHFHFHWGKTSGTGSEHRVDGHVYSAEVGGDTGVTNYLAFKGFLYRTSQGANLSIPKDATLNNVNVTFKP